MIRSRSGLWIPEAPNLILGRGPCPRRTLEVETSLPRLGVAGFIKVELIDSRTKQVRRKLEFRNLITDAGLNAIGSGTSVGSLVAYCGVGTNGTAPANGQTQLLAEVSPRINRAGTGDGTTGSGAAFAYWYYQRVFNFLETEANGNLQEVGFFTAVSAGTMWARQLFKDGVGTPTVLTKTNTDQLRITYEFRVYPPTVDVTGVSTISGVNYNYTIRASNINNNLVWGGSNGMLVNLGNWAQYSGLVDIGDTNVLASTSGTPAASSWVADTSHTLAAYTTGTFQRDCTNVWDPAIANFAGGVGSARLWRMSGASSFQQVWNPTKIPKDSTKRLTLLWRHTWGRYP
jgi:hypothetical protein